MSHSSAGWSWLAPDPIKLLGCVAVPEHEQVHLSKRKVVEHGPVTVGKRVSVGQLKPSTGLLC